MKRFVYKYAAMKAREEDLKRFGTLEERTTNAQNYINEHEHLLQNVERETILELPKNICPYTVVEILRRRKFIWVYISAYYRNRSLVSVR